MTDVSIFQLSPGCFRLQNSEQLIHPTWKLVLSTASIWHLYIKQKKKVRMYHSVYTTQPHQPTSINKGTDSTKQTYHNPVNIINYFTFWLKQIQ
jgi:hypothetical protein